MWEALQQISHTTNEAWCILADFNTILSKENRYGSNTVERHDIRELNSFMTNCEELEMPSNGASFTWTNKTLWSRLDRAFTNSLWHEVFDCTLVSTLPPGLSDQSPFLIQFHDTPKPPLCFQYCDMWSSH